MIYNTDSVMHELDGASCRLAMMLDEAVRAASSVPGKMLLVDRYATVCANAFTHIEMAKRSIRGISPLCQDIDGLARRKNKRRRR